MRDIEEFVSASRRRKSLQSACVLQRAPRSALSYHPEEVTELYLGSAMTAENKNDIIAKAKAVNPKIAIFQAKRDAKGEITFNRV